MPTAHDYCEFHRHSDEVVYQFDRVQREDGVYVYERRDKPLWIVCKPDGGWVVIGDDPDLVLSWPVDCLPESQPNYPPTGVWQSQKGEKSYIYTLIYPDSALSDA